MIDEQKIKIRKPIVRPFTVSETAMLIMYDTFYVKLQPYFRENNIHLFYTVLDSFVFCFETDTLLKHPKDSQKSC